MFDFYCCPLGGFGCLDFGFPQREGFVGGYFLLVSGCYCFGFSLSSWNYLVDGIDFYYSFVQNFKVVERERVEQS
jgi:hypothetical protein